MSRVRAFLRLVAVQHSVFALPFALISCLTAMRQLSAAVHWVDLALIVVAMVTGRTFAMAANRLIDRSFDARNPRTATRELVTGVVTVRTARIGTAVSLMVFLAAAAALNPLCLMLSPLAVVPLVAYPYAKRVMWAPQAVLGIAQAVAPVGAWLAVTGRWSDPSAAPAVVLGIAVGVWVAGFDMIYACQDVVVDREQGLGSIPARFGVGAALVIARWSHLATVCLLVLYGVATGAGPLWWAGVLVVAAALVYEHGLVRADDLSRVNRAFFTVNGFVGLALLGFAIADLLARGIALR
jgi:4-hydroxybenzoate polyprenyltransferase